MAEKVIISGEGVRLAVVAAEAVAEGLRRDRDPRASPVRLEVRPIDRSQWARGAAAAAIQAHILGRG